MNLGPESSITKFLSSSLWSWQVQFSLWETKFDFGLQFSKPICDLGELIDSEKDKGSRAAAPLDHVRLQLENAINPSLSLPTPKTLALGKVLGENFPFYGVCHLPTLAKHAKDPCDGSNFE